MANLNLATMTEAQLDKAYEAAVAHKNQVMLEIKDLKNKLVFDKNNEAIINLITTKEELKATIQEEIRAIRKA